MTNTEAKVRRYALGHDGAGIEIVNAADHDAAIAALTREVEKLREALTNTEAHLVAYIDAIESGGGSASRSAELLRVVRAALSGKAP